LNRFLVRVCIFIPFVVRQSKRRHGLREG
jgi:hypothetical protein